jgi:hypothetical protein
MIKKIIEKIKSFNEADKILLGSILANNIVARNKKKLSEYEFKVFSQWGEDGIIQYLVQALDIPNKNFIEFGVETYRESNTRFLLMHDNWSGLVIDGSVSNIKDIKNQSFFWRYSLNAVKSFITKENINKLLVENKMEGDIGILSIDIDGNDYWILKEINCVQPAILITEYNSVFGSERAISIPYKEDFVRGRNGISNLYYGASLAALNFAANQKGYSLIGCNSNGNNAFFVRNDMVDQLSYLKPLTVSDAFVDAKFREAKDKKNNLLYLQGSDRLEEVKGLPVINVITSEEEQL